MPKILVVDDDVELAGHVKQWLANENHSVEVVHDGKEGADRLRLYEYDAVVLDWDLPGRSGLEVCQQYRAGGGKTPILLLTGKSSIDEKEAGLDSGADDYLTKPFHMKELSARLRSIIRRSSGIATGALTVGELALLPGTVTVIHRGREIELLPKEYALVEFLMRHPNQFFSPEALLERVWSTESDATAATVRTWIYSLRKKLTVDGHEAPIETIRGAGYRLVATTP